MRQILAITLIILSINTLYTQTKKSKDITSIKKMCGCFEISFDFAETFIKTENTAVGAGLTVYANISAMPTSGPSVGDQAFNSDNNNMNIDNGLYFGRKDTFIDNQNIVISGMTNEENQTIKWEITKL